MTNAALMRRLVQARAENVRLRAALIKFGVAVKEDGFALQKQANDFLCRFQDEGTWHDLEAMELMKAIDTFFKDWPLTTG